MTWVCLDCTTAFSVGAPRCPHCGSERHATDEQAAALGIAHGVPVEIEEDSMPKITRHEGPSVAPVEEVEGGEDVSAGADTSTSSETPLEKPEQSEKPSPKPARMTGSRSRKARTDSSSAGSTGGGQAAGTSETDSADE